jgi:hypothetical protein
MTAADRFAPLGAMARRAAPAGEDAWAAILPAPLPPPAPLRHPRLGVPSAAWHYRDAAGALLFIVARFDPPGGRKQILPLACGAEGWRWRAPPAPRVLLGLDRLASRPGTPVLVVEGEKAAEAAAARFPEFVAVTWPGGARAVAQADWSALAGRLVLAWPDNDAPGREAAAGLGAAATAAGAARAVVLPAPRDWPEGWDLADPLPAGVTDAALRALVRGAMAAPEEKAAPEPTTDARGRAELQIDLADLPDSAAALAGLLAAQPHLFDRGGPARIARDAARDGFTVEPLTPSGVVTEAHRVARPWCWARNRDGSAERRDVTLPDRVAKLYLDNRDGWGLRPLDGIATAPLLHADGGIRAAEGYDAATRLWCERVPALDLPERPARAEAAAALARLRRWFRTFAFADAARVVDGAAPVPVVDPGLPPGEDESAFLTALLTAVCRPCLWLAPALLVRAPEYSGAGTGKGLLVRAIAAIAFGARPVAMTAGAGAEEFDKRITAALMGAVPVLFLDNVNSIALRSDVLASAITERPAAVRPLGRSATVALNPTAFIAVSGNGVRLTEDLARRFLAVELDAGTEDPEARDFRGDFLAETFAAREALLRDALTIWRWGRQMGDALPAGRALGSFTQWARWCRDPLVALGCRDPALRVAGIKAADPKRQQVAELFTAWWEAHGERPIPAADLAPAVLKLADPAGRGRQYVVARVRALDGTRAAGFMLVRSESTGQWTPDRYALRQTVAGAGTPMGPMPPMPSAGADGAACSAGAAAALARAEAAGMRLRLMRDGRVRMEADAPPPDDLLAALRRWREEVALLLAHRAAAAAMDHDAGEAAALAEHYAAPAAPDPYDPADPDPLRDGLLLGARMRPPAWPERHDPKDGGRWWRPRDGADGSGPGPGWRCWTCHPPVRAEGVEEVRS